MTAALDEQTRDGVILLTPDNPGQMNALNPDISRGVVAALHLAATDPGARAAVLTGAGEHFFSGGKLATMCEYLDLPHAAIVERIGYT